MAPPKSIYNSHKIKLVSFAIFILVGLIVTGSVFTREKFHLNEKVLQKAYEKYGQDAKMRLIHWENSLKKDSIPEREKLETINSFFNQQMVFVNDTDLYGVKDYWATPVEFISRGAGD